MAVQVFFLLEVLAAAFVLWLGLYSINRDLPWRHSSERLWKRPPILAGTGLALGSVYLFGNAMKTVSVTPNEFILWQRFTLWGIPLAVFLFLAAVVQLTYAGRPTPRRVYLLLSIVAAIASLLALAIVSGYLFDTGAIRAGDTILQPFYLPQRVPFGELYYGFLIAGLLGSIAVLLNSLPRTAGDADRTQKVWVGVAAGAFLLMGLLATFYFNELSHPYLPMQIGDFLAAIGALAVGYDIARHNALKHQRIIRADFWHSLTNVAVTTLLCLLAYLGFAALFTYPVQPLTVVLVSVFVVLTQTPFNWGDAVLDRLFLPQWVVGYRDQLLLMRHQPLTTSNPADSLATAEQTFEAILNATRTHELESLIKDEIEEIFKYRNFDNDELMSSSRLLELHITQECLAQRAQELRLPDDRLPNYQRADCLRSLLRSAIDDWSWSPEPPSRRTRIERIILRRKYVEQRSRVDVERGLSDEFELVITGGGYSRRLQEARAHLARVLYERELAYSRSAQTSEAHFGQPLVNLGS